MDQQYLNIAEHTKDHTDQSEIIDDIITCLLHQNPAEAFYAKIGARQNLYLATLHIGHIPSRFIFICLGCRCRTSQNLAVERFHKFKRDEHNHFDIPADYKPQDIIKDSFGIIKGSEVQTVRMPFQMLRHIFKSEMASFTST